MDVQGANHIFQPHSPDAADKPVFADPHLSEPAMLEILVTLLEKRLRATDHRQCLRTLRATNVFIANLHHYIDEILQRTTDG